MKTVFRFVLLAVSLCVVANSQTTVSAVSPAKHALNVSASTTIQVTFSDTMFTSTFNDTTSFIVSGMTSGRHLGTIVFSNGNTVATFTPAEAFAKGEIVTIDLTSNLQDAESTAITPFVYSFNVNTDRASGTYAAKVDYATTFKELGFANGLFVHDIDSDADGDIVVTNWGVKDFEDLDDLSNVTTMENSGDGTFVPFLSGYTIINSSFAEYLPSQYISDIDGDGDGDIVIASEEDGIDAIYTLKNNGDGTFASKQGIASLFIPNSVFVSDVDGDGDGDIAIGHYPNTVSILKNNGNGTFASAVEYSTGTNDAYSVFISDLDNDGDGDIAVANYGGADISILKNNGDGTFGTAADYATGNSPYRLFINDVDGDGDADIVTANSSSHTVSVLKNNGDGTFAANVDYATTGSAQDIFIGDVDGDGDGDIVVGNSGSATVSVLKNYGNGVFAPKADFTTGGPATSVFVSDVNGDGIADIIAANYSARTVSVLMGQPGPSVTTDNATNVDITTATVNGTVNANNATTTVRFVYGTTSGAYTDSITAAESPVSGTISTSVSGLLSGLSGNTTYYFRVAVSNTNGYVRGGEVSFTTTSSSPSATTISATTIGSTTTKANGTVNANGASTTVRFLYGTVSGTYTDSVTATQSPVTGSTNTSVSKTLTGLTANTTYFFRVAASNINGYVRGSELSFTTDSTASTFGYALEFDGVNDYVNLGNSSVFNVGAAVTYEAWINPDTAHNGYIFNKWVNAAEDKQLVFSGNRVYFYLHSVFSLALLGSSSTIPFDQFTHIAATYDGSTAKLYINGVFDTSKSVSGNVSTSSGNLFIGHNADRGDANNPFNGMMDEFRIWNTTRTESEIQETMNQPLTGDEIGLVGYWSFDEGAGTTTADMTSNGNDGTISGATWVNSEAALPVELTSFSASAKQGKVELLWKTATEVNNAGFAVERKAFQASSFTSETSNLNHETSNWREVVFIEGNGTSNSPKEYSFTDKNLSSGKYSYRLKQIDNDGKFSYSQEVEVMIAQMPQIFALMQNYPNPFNPTTNISFTLQTSGFTTLKVYDVIGREVATLVNELKETGSYTFQFNASQLASGFYVMRLRNGNNVQAKKMQLLK